MKTVKKGDQIVRKTNEEAEEMVKKGWAYCKKAEWKKIRHKSEQVKEETVIEIEEKPKKSKKKSKKNKNENVEKTEDIKE